MESKPELQRVLEHRRRDLLIKQKKEEEEAKKLQSPFEKELLKRHQRLDQVELSFQPPLGYPNHPDIWQRGDGQAEAQPKVLALLPLHKTGAKVHPPLLPHTAAALSSSQWDPPCLYHFAQHSHYTPLPWVSSGSHTVSVGCFFPVQRTLNCMGAVAAPTTGGLRILQCGVRGCRSAGRNIAAISPKLLWRTFCVSRPKFCLGKVIFTVHLTAAQPCPGWSVPALLHKPVQAVSRLITTENKVIASPTCQNLHCKWMKPVFLINNTTTMSIKLRSLENQSLELSENKEYETRWFREDP